jgi:hypothetical protein
MVGERVGAPLAQLVADPDGRDRQFRVVGQVDMPLQQ